LNIPKALYYKQFALQNLSAEHIILSFSENIISRFDVSVNDVVKKFAKRLQSKIKDSILKYYIAKQKNM